MILSIDTETTGLDLRHGARPFFISTCKDDGDQWYCEWDVDPFTRKPIVKRSDLDHLLALIEEAELIVFHNTKFDVAAIDSVCTGFGKLIWNKPVHDTLIGAHLDASDQPKDLTSLSVQLGVDIEPWEKRLKDSVKKAQRLAKREFPLWRHARAWKGAQKGLKEMPSCKGATYGFEYWMPRAVASELKYRTPHMGCSHLWKSFACTKCGGHSWWIDLRDYANVDTVVTIKYYQLLCRKLQHKGLWKIFLERCKLLRIVYEMEERGVTLSKTRLKKLYGEYKEEAKTARNVCVNIAREYNYTLEMPRSGVNDNLRTFCFDVLKLPKLYKKKSKTNAPTLDTKNALEPYLVYLEKQTDKYTFVKSLMALRKRVTALTYMRAYERFAKVWGDDSDFWLLNPSINPTGTHTIRFSSQNPNAQNISKKEGFNLRYCFGPAPGREWWSLDYENIELRIPAYASGEEDFIALFERPDDPPYFGSNHLLIAHVLFPKEFDQCIRDGVSFKERYKSTLYQNVKNGNFAVLYGAVNLPNGMGTADRTYGIPGAQSMIAARFAKMEELNKRQIRLAKERGYIETIPVSWIDPNHGYPLWIDRTEYGIRETTPLNFFSQGTAMEATVRAMVRTDDQLREWRNKGFDAYIALQVHDELDFDFPKAGHPIDDPLNSNLGKIRKIKRLMEMSGDDIGVPLSVSVTYHPNNWSEGVDVKV